MKVLFYQPGLDANGAIISTLRTAKGLAENNISVFLATGYISNEMKDQLSNKVELKLINKRARWHAFYLSKMINEIKPDVVISSIPLAAMVTYIASKISFFRTKVVIIERTSPKTEVKFHKSKLNKSYNLLRKLYFPKVDKIIAISYGVKDEIVELFNIAPNKIQVIYNPTITDEKVALSHHHTSHPWLNGEQNAPVILGVGRLCQQKDFPTLIHAFSLVRKKRPCKLIIIGEGEDRNEIELLIKELGLEQDIDLLGYIENPHPYMRKSDIFVLSSLWEGFGNVLVESMAYGTSVVSTNCLSGPSEILDNGKIAPLVKPGDSKAMATAICQVLEKPQPASILTSKANTYSEQNSIKQFISLLYSL